MRSVELRQRKLRLKSAPEQINPAKPHVARRSCFGVKGGRNAKASGKNRKGNFTCRWANHSSVSADHNAESAYSKTQQRPNNHQRCFIQCLGCISQSALMPKSII